MLLPGENSPKIWLFLTILVSTIVAFSETSEGKTIDIKIGFDLTQGSNGAPSLRIRDFEDSAEYNPRAVDDASSSGSDSSSSSSKKKTSPRADSSISGDREHSRKEQQLSKEPAKPVKSSNDSDDDDDKSSASHEDTPRSTRGLKAGDFEPEEANPKIHGRYQKVSDSDTNNSDESSRRRNKRHIDRFGYRKVL